MHTIAKYEPGVVLFSRAGTVTRYDSLKSALAELGFRWIKENVGVDFTTRFYREYSWSWSTCSHILQTDYGASLTAADFLPFVPKPVKRWWARLDYNGVGPVPGVRKYRGGRRHFRLVRTMNECRAAALVLPEEGEVPPRPRRNEKNIPDSWDEIHCSSRRNRNWKRYRKTQWKCNTSAV